MDTPEKDFFTLLSAFCLRVDSASAASLLFFSLDEERQFNH